MIVGWGDGSSFVCRIQKAEWGRANSVPFCGKMVTGLWLWITWSTRARIFSGLLARDLEGIAKRKYHPYLQNRASSTPVPTYRVPYLELWNLPFIGASPCTRQNASRVFVQLSMFIPRNKINSAACSHKFCDVFNGSRHLNSCALAGAIVWT